MSGDLTLDVYVSDYKPIPGDPTVMSHELRLISVGQSDTVPSTERVSTSREELVEKMLAAHRDRGNPYSLWAAATAAFRAR